MIQEKLEYLELVLNTRSHSFPEYDFSFVFYQLKPHYRHLYSGDCVLQCGDVSHVRLVIAPDGGVSRLRLWGHVISSNSTKPCQISKLWPFKLQQSSLLAQNGLSDMLEIFLKRAFKKKIIIMNQSTKVTRQVSQYSCILKWYIKMNKTKKSDELNHCVHGNLNIEMKYYTCCI